MFRKVALLLLMPVLLSGCASKIDHSTPQTLAESYLRAAIDHDFEAMVEAWSPAMRAKLREYCTPYNISESELAAFTLELGGSEGKAEQRRIADDPAEFARAAAEMAALPVVTGDREEGLVFIGGKWYLQFY